MKIPIQLRKAARLALTRHLGIQKSEKILVITDRGMRGIGDALFEESIGLSGGSSLELVKESRGNYRVPGNWFPGLRRYHVVICLTCKPLLRTALRNELGALGARVVVVPYVSASTFIRCLDCNFNEMSRLTVQLGERLSRANRVYVTTSKGTHLKLDLSGRTAIANNGIFITRGKTGYLLPGETYIALREGTAEGMMVIDGTIAGIGRITHPVSIEVQKGCARGISGRSAARKFRNLLETLDKNARAAAEFGFGTNDKAILSGNPIEDVKVPGTVHIGLGSNYTMGGTISVDSHFDCVIKNPTVRLDEELVMKEGKFIRQRSGGQNPF